MHAPQRIAAMAIILAAAGTRSLAGQIDYRNLDDHRPVRTEDAYPIERYAFELLLPYEYEDSGAGDHHHVLAPELSYGLLPNAQVGVRLPVATREDADGTDWGLAGVRVFGLYNFNTESRALPAFSVRTDLAFPVGTLAEENVRVAFKGIATRSWGLTRIHLNGSVSPGADSRAAEAEAEPEWSVSLAADRTFLRHSLLVVGEVAVLEHAASSATEVTAGLGIRYQLTPTLVLDTGISRRLGADAGPDLGLTFGLSHAFAIAGLLPAASR